MSADYGRTTADRGPTAADCGLSLAVVRRSSVVRRPSSVFAMIFLLALALRFYQLTYHSLWFDEVMSTFWAARPVAEIWRVGLALTQDKHPPFYYLLLHFWTAVFGPGDAAVRSLGALLGALAVLPVYAIGARLGGRRVGLLAALLVALNPFLIWYSQEARMFMPATTFALYGVLGIGYWVFGANQRSPDAQSLIHIVWPLLLAIIGLTAALYTYLFSAFLLPVAGAWLVIGWWVNRRTPGAGRRFWPGAGALAVVGLLFLPLARSAWLVSGGESLPGRAFEGMAGALWRLLQVYAVGWPGWSTQAMAAVATGAAALAAVGLAGDWGLGSRDSRRQSLLPNPQYLIAWLVLPLLAGGLLLARDRTVFAETRYFIFLVPALCLVWAQGIARLWGRWRPAGGLALALAVGVTLAALPALWSPGNRREAWREAAAFVQAHAGPNDAVVVQADYVHLAFERYFGGPQPVYFPFTDRLTDPAQVDPPLVGLAQYDAIWLVQSHHQELDPGNLVAGWFGARFPLITEAYPAGIAIHGFAQRYRTAALPPGVPGPNVGAGPVPVQGQQSQGGVPTLLACVHASGPLAARDDLYHPPSSWIHVTTYWTADRALTQDIHPRVRLVDAAGQMWGLSLERSNDAFHVWPTSRWLPGEVVRADFDVNLNPITPAGTYRIVIALPGTTGELTCGQVLVTP